MMQQLGSLPRLAMSIAVAGLMTVTCSAAPTPTPASVAQSTAPASVTQSPEPQRGGRVVQAVNRLPSTWDPNTADFFGLKSLAKVYNNLLWNPGGDTIECDLCSSWEYQDGGKRMVFHLRPNVRFHDGRSLTAADVVYSLNRILGRVGGVVSARIGFLTDYVDTVEAPDTATVVLNLFRPAPVVAAALTIVPAGIVPNGATREDLQQRPMGTGPFRLKESVSGSHVILERNPDYFKPGLPYLDEWEMRFLTEGEVTQSAFLVGSVDMMISNANLTPGNEGRFRTLQQAGEIQGGDIPSISPLFLVFNLNKPPFDNQELRRAVHLAIDRDAWCTVIYLGGCTPIVLFAADSAWGRSAAEISALPGFRKPKDQDLAEAKAIVQRLYPQGVTVQVTYSSGAGMDPQGEFVAGALTAIGMTVELVAVENTQFNSTLRSGNFQVANQGFSIVTGDPDEMLSNLRPGVPRNYSGFNNAEFNEIFVQQSSEADVNKRKELIRKAGDVLLRDLPMVPILERTNAEYWWSKVQFTPGITRLTQERMELVWLKQ